LPTDGFKNNGDIQKGNMVEHKNILTGLIMLRLKNVSMKNTQHEEYKIGPGMA
jgi:hypothetical protein